MQLSTWIALLGLAVVVLLAARRSPIFAVFAIVILGIPTYVAVALGGPVGELRWLLLGLQLAAAAHFLAIALRPRMRGGAFRWGVSLPGLYFVAASLLALPWAIAASFGLEPWGWWLPFGIALGGLWQSLHGVEENVAIALDGTDAGPLARHAKADERPGPALRLVQITDPHLGPFMTVERLRRICERAVARDPDLILVTGDLMTMESHDLEVVAAALEPLRGLPGRVFACHGNHDHEARAVVAEACRRHGITLLVDDAVVVQTRVGPVQIVGADFSWRERAAHLRGLSETFPRIDGCARIWLLHDPGAFVHLPGGDADLVLSGHTHGGQLGLLSFGLQTTIVSALTRVPDHGFWAHGRNRLYVHRAQGHYGYPLRLGVPSEQSMLHVYLGPRSK